MWLALFLVVTLNDLLSSGLEQEGGVGRVGLPGHFIPLPEVVSLGLAVTEIVLGASQEAIETVEPASVGPELLVAEPKVPLANDVCRVVASLEFICQGGEAGVQPVGNSGM